MAFVNEKGGLARIAESQKYAELCNKATGRNMSFINEQWTIDREREMLLICTYIEREDMYKGDFELSYWTFYWHGQWIIFTQRGYFKKISDTYWKVTRKITEVDMQKSVKMVQLEMFSDLKDAFNEFKIIGCRSLKEYQCDLTLDYSEVL